MASKKINYSIGFTIDKTGLNELQSTLQNIYLNASNISGPKQFTNELKIAGQTARNLEKILQDAYNPKLGTINISKFNQGMKEAGYNASILKQNLSYDKANGAYAFNQLSRSILNTNSQLVKSNKLLDKMGETLGNTIRWSITSSLINSITGSIQKAYTYTKQLDTSLNNIRIVTGKSADEMDKFADKANQAAKALGASTLDYTKASLIYYQQGLSDTEAQARAETTVKVANITGQTGDAVSEQLTAVWNGYKVSAQETEQYIDKLAAVAATTASDLEELSTGMSKVASAANAMGVEFDDLNAQIATIVSVTRQAPESVGTALKTIYARLGDLKVDGVDEFGVKLGEVSSQLQTMGIQILDTNGDMRDMTSVMTEVAEKWNTWTRAQQQAAAVAMAGKRQYNNLVALFENWDMYSKALDTSKNSLGTLQEQQDIYMESTAAKLKTLKATSEGLYQELFNQDEIKAFIPLLNTVVDLFTKVVKNFGGGIKSLAAFGAIITNIFSQQISNGLNSILSKQSVIQRNLELAKKQEEYAKVGFSTEYSNDPKKIAIAEGTKEQLKYAEKIFEYKRGLNEEDAKHAMNLQKEIGYAKEAVSLAEQEFQKYAQKNDSTLNKTVKLASGIDNEGKQAYTEMTIQKALEAGYGIGPDSELMQAFDERYSKALEITANIDEQKEIAEELDKLEEKRLEYSTKIEEKEKELNEVLSQEKNIEENIENAQKNKSNATKEQLKEIDKLIIKSNEELQALQEKEKVIKRSLGAVKGNATKTDNKTNDLVERQNTLKSELPILQAQEQEHLKENAILAEGKKIIDGKIKAEAEYKALQEEINLLLKDAQRGNNITTTITSISSVMSTLAMSINSIRTLFDVWTDDTRDKGEKILQFFMTLGMTIPMTISAVKKFSETTGISFGFVLNKTKLLTEAEEADTVAKKANILAQEAHKKAVEADALVAKIKNGEVETSITLQEAEEMATAANSEAKIKETAAIKANTAAQELNNKAKKANSYGYFAIAIVAATIALTAYSKAQEKAEEKIIKANKQQQEEIEKKQELLEKNEELYVAYEALYKQYQKSREASDALKDSALELANAYDIVGGRVYALTGKFDTLHKLASQQRIENLKEQIKEAENHAILTTSTLNKNADINPFQYVKKSFSELGADSFLYTDIDKSGQYHAGYYRKNAVSAFGNGWWGDQQGELNFVKKTDNYNGPAAGEEVVTHLSRAGIEGTIDYKTGDIRRKSFNTNDAEAYLNYIEETEGAIKYLNDLLKDENSLDYVQSRIELENVRDRLKEELATFDPEQIESLREEVKKIRESNLRYDIAIKLGEIDSKDTKTIYDEVSKLKEKYKDAFEDTDFNSIIAEELSYANINDQQKVKIELLLEIEKKNNVTKEIKDYVNKLNAQQIAYVQMHLDTKKADEDLLKWLNKTATKRILNYQELSGKTYAQQNLLMSGTDKGFKEEDIDSFFEDETNLSISKDTFLGMDTGQQITQVANEYIQNVQKITESHDKLLASYTKLKQNANEELTQYQEDNEEVLNSLKEKTTGSVTLQGREEDILEALITDTEDLTTSQQVLLGQLEASGDITEEDINKWREYAFEINRLEVNLETIKNDINDLNNTERNYLKTREQLNNAQKANNATIDSAQSAYNSLLSMVKEYNSSYKWTIDNIQTLMTMDDAYVAQLQFENGQLKLNEEGFKNLTIAKLQDEIVMAELEYQLTLSQLATIATANANDYAAQHTELFKNKLQELGLAVGETTETLYDYDEATKIITGKGSPEIQAAAEEAKRAFENRKKAAEAGIAQAMKGGFSFSNMMDSSKSSSKDKKKTFDEEFDRYWEFKKAIDMLDKSMARLQKTQEKLHGKELIDSLKKENELLEKQKANYDALLRAQEQEVGELWGKLEYFGATFTDNGELTNYADVTKKMLDAYTSGTVSEKAYEDFKKALERYDTLYYSEVQDTLDKLDDARRKQLENNLKGWETEIQVKLDLTEAERNWNDFVRDLEQDFRKIYEDLTIESAYDTANFDTYVDDLNTTLQAIYDVENEITKLSSVGKSDMFESMSEAQEKLKDLGNELIENGKNLYELYESVWDNYISQLDQSADNLKDINDEFGHITNELEYEKKLIELIYGDKAYDKMTKYYDAQQKNINMQIDSLKTQRDFWEDQFQAAYMMNKEEHNVILNDMSTWTEDMRKAYDQMIESQESLNDKITEGIENLTDNYLNKLAETFDKLENAVWNMNLDALSDDWDRITGLADEYLDDVEGAYEIQNLANQIDKDINNTSDIKAAQRLQAFREKEIAILREKDNLTQDDVDLAEARYQIMLKEIALEDAQNAKNSMKLTRNTSGNWTYQYVADDEDVADKRQDLLQSYQNLYKMADDAYQHAMELATGSYQEMQDKIREIAEDTTLAEEEKMLKIQEIQDTYLPMIEAAVENSELYRQEAVTATGAVFEEVCQQDADAYQYLTDLQKELVDGVRDKHLEDYEAIRSAVVDGVYPEIAAAAQSAFLETNLNSSTAAADVIHQWADDDGESVKDKLNEAIDSIEENVQGFEKELDNMKVIAGKDFTDVDTEIDTTTKLIEEMERKTKNMTEKSSEKIGIMRTAVEQLSGKFDELKQKIYDTAKEMADYRTAIAAAVEEMINLNYQKSIFDGSEYDPSATFARGGSSSNSYTSKYKVYTDPYGASKTLNLTDQYGNRKIIGGEAYDLYEQIKNSEIYYDPYGVSGTARLTDGTIVSKDKINNTKLGDKYYNIDPKIVERFEELIGGTIAFASGGYTGDWSSDHGALAILHNKELVLNEDDTSNFLKATSLLRDISKINGSIEDSIMTSILGMMSALSPRIGGFSASSSGSQESSGNIFNITAEFPNANDVTSIREAILSLPNIASQYVHQR